MTGNHGQDAEEESPASEGEAETVGKPTGKAPDMQNVWGITETVMEDEESSSEVNQRADQMEFIKDFQDAMNQAIEQLLNKSARRHSR